MPKTLKEKLDKVRALWANHTERAIQRAEREAIIEALDEAGRSGMKAATDLLGITTHELWEKIETHDLTPTWKKRKNGNSTD